MNDKLINLSVYFENQSASADLIEDSDISIFSDVSSLFLNNLIRDHVDNSQILNLNLLLVDSNEIKRLNKEYRDKDKITDVLSFPQHENLRHNEFEFFAPEEELGDIIICLEVCRKQALEHMLSFEEEFLHLAVHGFLHLCGYDHELGEEEERLMESLEEKMLLEIKEKRSRD